MFRASRYASRAYAKGAILNAIEKPLMKVRGGTAFVAARSKAETREDSLRQLADWLVTKGLVYESYVPALLSREDSYPTGLQVPDGAVAIPHAAAEHAIKATVAVCQLESPVAFKRMDDTSADLGVSLFFMLAVPDSNEHLNVLSSLAELISGKGALRGLMEASSNEELLGFSAELLSENAYTSSGKTLVDGKEA